MIAAAIATTITATIESTPCEARTAHAITAVSPGSGSPNDSNANSTKSSSSAHWLCWSMKVVIEARSVVAYACAGAATASASRRVRAFEISRGRKTNANAPNTSGTSSAIACEISSPAVVTVVEAP